MTESPRQEKKSVTLHDLAKAAGCSANTVSLALRDSSRISRPLRQRIALLANEMGYTPNYAARNLRSRRSGLIGVYLTHLLYDVVRSELVNQLYLHLHTAEYRPVLGMGAGDGGSWVDSPWMETFRQLQVEALVVLGETGSVIPDWAAHLPIVFVGGDPDPSLNCDCLALDRTEAGRLAASHLMERGHRRIMIASTPEYNFASAAALTIRDAGLPVHFIEDPNFNRDIELARVLGRDFAPRVGSEFDGLIFGDTGDASAFVRGLLDAGKRVPDDVAVVAYDYFPWADMLAVPLTTIDQPLVQMAAEAVAMIQKRLADPDGPRVHTTLPHTLIRRQST